MTGLSVWWDGRVTGSLHLDRHGEMEFTYAPEWLADAKAPALSFSLPKRAEAFGRRECQPFFGGILPEEGQRHAIARALGVSAENEFRLLEHLGGEVAGALTLLPDGEVPQPLSSIAPDILSDDRLLALLDRLPVRPMLAGEGGLRLSLAGAQSKLPVCPSCAETSTRSACPPTRPRFHGPVENVNKVNTLDRRKLRKSLAPRIGLDLFLLAPLAREIAVSRELGHSGASPADVPRRRGK